MKRDAILYLSVIKDLAGMRDECIHMYFGVNYHRVWQAVKNDIPRVRPELKSLLDEIRGGRG
jgi:uncharacterized protein with HEPN domain